MRTYPFLFVAVLAVSAICTPASSADYYVDAVLGADINDGSESFPWQTITHALESVVGSASQPVTIHVAPGIYNPESGESFPLNMGSYIRLLGDAPDMVIIDAGGTGRVVEVRYCRPIEISSVTITGGYLPSDRFSLDNLGAGLSLESVYPGFEIRNCVIRGNSAYGGAGIALTNWAAARLVDCVIEDNHAVESAGIRVMLDCKLVAQGCVITRNVASAAGGCSVSANSTLNLINCEIVENRSESGSGGAIYTIDRIQDADPLALNCIFRGNYAARTGGAIVAFLREQKPIGLLNCTFVSNVSDESGRAISVFEWIDIPARGTLELRDCIFRDGGDEILEETDGIVAMNNSCIEGGWDGHGEGNFDADPLFVTGPLGDYYLSQTAAGQAVDSPCVDAGSMSAYSAGIADKTTRTDSSPDTGVVDIGYHHPTLLMMPEVRVSTPSNTYSHGDTLEMVFEAINPNPFSYAVDFYAAIIAADGVIWTIDANWNWSASLNPWFASLELPANFTFGATTLLTIALPSAVPPISEAGTYWVAAAFAHVGTTSFIAEPSISPFELVGN